MTNYTKADVYRHAAEVIVRDGKTRHELTERGDTPQYLADPSIPVCALGACFRAEYELNGHQFPEYVLVNRSETAGYFPYKRFEFCAAWGNWPENTKIWAISDDEGTSAEDIALLLKRHAEEIESE